MTGVSSKLTRRESLQYSGSIALGLLTAGYLENGEDEAEGVVVGTEAGFPPFEMIEDGEIVGFDVDLTEAVLEEAEDYELEEWRDMEFGSLIPALQDGSIDLIAAAMTITDERQEEIAFSDPYFDANQSVLVAEGGDFQPESLEDFDGHAVGAQVGTTGEEIVEEELIQEERIDATDYSSYDSYVLAVQDLERGIVDAIVIDRPVGESFADERNVEVAFVHETGEEFGLGVRQEDEELLEAINEGLETVEEESEYDELVAKWFGEDDEETETEDGTDTDAETEVDTDEDGGADDNTSADLTGEWSA